VKRENIGLPLRQLKGHWNAGGHMFDDDMRCSLCRRTWARHQEDPAACPRYHDRDEFNEQLRADGLRAAKWRKELARRIRVAMCRRGWTQPQLAAESGLPRWRVERFMREHRECDASDAEALGKALGLPSSKFLRSGVHKP
jgi:ribosome-binding protein aMBF1 (putative translation factor)